MKVKLSYEFELPEESNDMDIQVAALRNYCALADVYNVCRNYMKYEDITDETHNILKEIRNLIPDLN